MSSKLTFLHIKLHIIIRLRFLFFPARNDYHVRHSQFVRGEPRCSQDQQRYGMMLLFYLSSYSYMNNKLMNTNLTLQSFLLHY